MLKTLIIADDSTGANASAILLNQLNFSTLSLIDYEKAKIVQGYDAIAVSTDSRGVDNVTAYKRTLQTLDNLSLATPKLLNKRIDSTLRGNLGAELNAFKEKFPSHKIAIVPSFPSSNRICKDGNIYVNDILLEKTDVAKDPKMPLDSSNAKSLFLKQFKGSIENIYLKDVRGNNLSDLINDHYQTYDAILFDATTNEDIEIIANTLIKQNQNLIVVDPGPFTFYTTKALIKSCDNIEKKRYIYLVGSVTDTTFEQLKTAYQDPEFLVLPINANDLLEDNIDTSLLIKKIKDSSVETIIITTVDPVSRNILNLFDYAKNINTTVDDISKKINNHLGHILEETLNNIPNIAGIFTSGGDVTLSFLHLTSAEGIHLLEQVMPLCVYGKIVGGRFDGLPIITKGGMIGEKSAYITIKDYFKERSKYE